MEEEVLAPEEELEVESPDESTEVEEAVEEESTEEEVAEEPEEEPKPSRRESLRIQSLISKMKQDAPAQAPKQTGLDYGTALDADETVIRQLEADRQTYGQTQYNAGLEQAKAIEFRTLLEIDAPKVESKYAVLDKESNEFNPVVADAINSWYLSTVGYNPQNGRVANSSVRYSDFVEGIMELADEMAGTKVASTTKNIAKQAAQTGLRPGGNTAPKLDLSKAPKEMSDKELDAMLAAQGLSSKKRR